MRPDREGPRPVAGDGELRIPNNPWMRTAGAEDPREDALRLMARLAYPALYDPRAPQLDYHAEIPENVAPYGRVLTAIPEPGAMVWPGVFLADGLLAHLRARCAPRRWTRAEAQRWS